MGTAARAAVLATCLVSTAAPALAHEGNPNFRSTVDRVSPRVAGLRAEVTNLDDSLQVTSSSDRTVVVQGYRGEPYLRFLPGGRVERNRRSPATYLNADRYGEGALPKSADAGARPEWERVASNGRFAWHDHRIHYMSRNRPPVVKDPGRETKVFDWKVPIATGGSAGTISGTLRWVPAENGFPVAPFAGLATLVFVAAFAVFRRRRRGASEGREAW